MRVSQGKVIGTQIAQSVFQSFQNKE